MSLQVPITAQIPRPKAYFYFYSPLQTIFSSPTISDTTAVSTTSTTRTTAKTYSLTIPSPGNRIRVIIYGRVYSSTETMTVWLNIDGADVASASTSSTSEVVVLDYGGSITSGSHSIKIDFLSFTGVSVEITKVYIATGIGLTSTSPVNLLSFTVSYQLLRSGDIRYSGGARVFVWGNRKTTASLTLTIPEATSITVGRNNLGAGNDNDKAETLLAILTGSVALQEGGEFTLSVTLSGNVGASGNVVIITRIQARAQLKRETGDVGEVRVYERGVAEYAARALLVSVPGGVGSTAHQISRRDVQDRYLAWIAVTGGGSDVTFHNFRVPVVTPIHFTTSYSDDSFGEVFLEWVQVVVWG
jgi:hypothetical protein